MSTSGSTAETLRQVELLVLDFDGVMTDNRVLVMEDGTEAVWCHRGDGWGLARLRDAGFPVVVLSTEKNLVVTARCRKLGLPSVQGQDDKLGALEALVAERGLGPEQVAYVGNDINDLACLEWVGVPIIVADAHESVRDVARLTTSEPGGHGAVREVAEWILTMLTARAGGIPLQESAP